LVIEKAIPQNSTRLQSEQAAAIFKSVGLGVTCAAAGAVAIVLMFIHVNWIPQVRGCLWALYIVACASGHLVLRHLYYRTSNRQIHTRRWLNLFTAFSLAEGIGWGWATVELVTPGHTGSVILVMACAVAIAAGTVSAWGAYLPAFWAFFFAATAPFTAINLFGQDPLLQTGSILMLLYLVGVGGMGLIGSRNFQEIVALRIKSSDLADSLKIQKEIAETANVAKSTFLAAASHDLRQPVHALGLFVGALRSVDTDIERQDLISKIESSVAAMDSLFGSLLDISRLDAGVVEVRPSYFPIQPLIQRLCEEHLDEADAKGIELLTVPSSAVVLSDPILLERILRNLIANAVRYTSRGRVLIGCRRRKGLSIQVWDTGSGIPAELQDRVFEEYFQLGNIERDRGKGLGLGLAIVRRLTELLGCPLALSSQVGRGSCFSVQVERAPRGHLAIHGPEDEGVGALASAFIVVVDDEAPIRDAMTALLTGWGHRVVAAASGSELLEQIASEPSKPALIICDYRLRAGETGIDVIERLRSEYNEPVPAVLITGDTAPDRLLEAAASQLLLLHKPVPKSKLRAALAHLLQKSPDGEREIVHPSLV
jgi:two-component system, sensor histidine kinase